MTLAAQQAEAEKDAMRGRIASICKMVDIHDQGYYTPSVEVRDDSSVHINLGSDKRDIRGTIAKVFSGCKATDKCHGYLSLSEANVIDFNLGKDEDIDKQLDAAERKAKEIAAKALVKILTQQRLDPSNADDLNILQAALGEAGINAHLSKAQATSSRWARAK
jgi:hypothetical protein